MSLINRPFWKKYFLFPVIFNLLFIGCSKDSEQHNQVKESDLIDQPDPTGQDVPGNQTAPENPLLGVWRYTDSLPFENIRYLEFSEEELTLYKEHELYKFRDKVTGPYQNTDSTFTFTDVIPFRISGDSLVIPSMQGDEVFLKDADFLEDDWANPTEILDSFESPVNALTDFDLRNDMLWMGNGKEPGLFIIDPVAEMIVDTLMPDLPITAFKYFTPFQSFFALPGDNNVHQYSFTNQQAALFANDPDLNAPISGLAVANGKYVVASDEFMVQLNSNGEKILDLNIDMDLKGLAFSDNGYLYACSNNYINVCQIDPFLTIATFRIGELDSLGGIAFDSDNKFWVSGKMNGTEQVKMINTNISIGD